jgi:hypothetical protein
MDMNQRLLHPYPSTFGGKGRGDISIVYPNWADECLAQVHYDWAKISACGGVLECCAPGVWNYGNPPWMAMPPEGRQFRKTGGIALPANLATSTIATFRVQPGYEGIINSIIVNVVNAGSTGFAEDSGDLVWRLEIGRSYAKDLGNIRTQLGNLASPFPLFKGIRVFPGQLITLSVDRPNAIDPLDAQDRIIGMLSGYFYPVHRGYAAQVNLRNQ